MSRPTFVHWSSRTQSQDRSHDLSFEALMKTYWVWVKWWWVCLRQWLSVSQNILSKLVNTPLCLEGCYTKPNKHNKQIQQLLLRKQAERLRQMSNDLLKMSIQIDFLHWREGTCCPSSGPGALRSSHTHFSFLVRTGLFWAAKTHQRASWKCLICLKRNVHIIIKSKNKKLWNLQEAFPAKTTYS